MILSINCKDTKKVSKGEYTKKWSLEIRRIAMRRLDYLNAAINLKDLRIPPSNRLHPLEGNLQGYYSVSVNVQWRIIFRWHEGHAHDVRMIDYH